MIRPITDDDVEHLLKIPIRRISLYDMNKNRKEVQAINARLKEIARLLKHIVDYAISSLTGIEQKLDPEVCARKTTLTNIKAVDVKSVVKRNTPLRYNEKDGNFRQIKGTTKTQCYNVLGKIQSILETNKCKLP